jgi:hypothetical protein
LNDWIPFRPAAADVAVAAVALAEEEAEEDRGEDLFDPAAAVAGEEVRGDRVLLLGLAPSSSTPAEAVLVDNDGAKMAAAFSSRRL